MTVIVGILLVMFGLDPSSGHLQVYDRETKILDTREEQIKKNEEQKKQNTEAQMKPKENKKSINNSI